MTAQEVLLRTKAAGVVLRLEGSLVRATRLGGQVPEAVVDLLREQREVVLEYLQALGLEQRWGKAPAPAESPPMRATKPVMTDIQRKLALDYVMRQPGGGALHLGPSPLVWVWARIEEYRKWALTTQTPAARWEPRDIAAAAVLDFLCWQRQTTDIKAIRWVEDMDAAYEDLCKVNPAREREKPKEEDL